jgi:hypothetical protein
VNALAQPHPHMLHVAHWRNLDCLGVDEANIVPLEITDARNACKGMALLFRSNVVAQLVAQLRCDGELRDHCVRTQSF